MVTLRHQSNSNNDNISSEVSEYDGDDGVIDTELNKRTPKSIFKAYLKLLLEEFRTK